MSREIDDPISGQSYQDEEDEEDDDEEEGRELYTDMDEERDGGSVDDEAMSISSGHSRLFDGLDAADESMKRVKTSRISQNVSQEESEVIKEHFTNTLVENGPNGLGVIDAIQVSTVLEELSDQLDIIGTSIDAPQVDLRTQGSVDFDIMCHRPVISIPGAVDPYGASLFKEKYILRQHYESITPRRIEQLCNYTPGTGKRNELRTVLREHGISKFSNSGKVQADRTLINIILDNLVTELIQKSTFYSLIDAIANENSILKGMQEKIRKNMEDKQRIVDTRRNIKNTKLQKKSALKLMQNTIWQIEDSTQEIRCRKELESLYVQHDGAMLKARVKKMCTKNEKSMKKKYEHFKLKIRNYERSHHSMMEIINKKYKEAQRRLEYWIDKYDIDKETLQTELDMLKFNRARDLERIKWLKLYIKDYGQIVDDNRRIKNIESERIRIAELKEKKAVVIQAWWRGEMVRHWIGPYRADFWSQWYN